MYIVASIDASIVALADFGSHHGVGHNLYATPHYCRQHCQ